MQILSQEHDEKYLKGGIAGGFIGAAISALIVLLFIHHHPAVAAFVIAVAMAFLLIAGMLIDLRERDTIKEVH
jgi:phosphate starvation-inducible membrane PsiE